MIAAVNVPGQFAAVAVVERKLVDVDPVGDLDRDGIADVAACTNRDYQWPELITVSTRTGEPIWSSSPPPGIGRDFGEPGSRGVAAVDDLDGDGIGEVAALWRGLAPGAIRWTYEYPRARRHVVGIHRGADGAILRCIEMGPLFEWTEVTSIEAAPDLDQDGTGDLVVVARGSLRQSGFLAALSTRTGSKVFETAFEIRAAPNAESICWFDDDDRDGVRDFVLGITSAGWGNPQTPIGARRVPHPGYAISVYSGRTGSHVRALDLRGGRPVVDPRWGPGWQLAVTDDLDGDGRFDLLAPITSPSGGAGLVRCFSGTDGRFHADLDPEIWALELDEVGVRGIGDVDGDGIGDVLVADPGWNAGGVESCGPQCDVGGVRVMSVGAGYPGRTIWLREGHDGYSRLGELVVLTHDVTGDGVRDIWASFGECGPWLALLSGRTGSTLQWIDVSALPASR